MARKAKQDTTSKAQERKNTLTALYEGYQGDDLASQMFRKGVELDADKRELFAVIAANRTSLRALAVQDLVSAQDVDALYPPKASAESAEEEAA
jgi:hypothetical protein